MSTEVAWYSIENIDQIDSPTLLIYRDRVQHNIDRLLEIMPDTNRLRPHIKTSKSKETVSLLMDSGIHKFKCATIAEAELLGQCYAQDVLLAYQPIGPKQARLIRLIQAYPNTNYSCLIDNLETARQISNLAALSKNVVQVFIDVNVGMGRSGIAPGKAAIDLFTQMALIRSLKIRGLHAYDGHIRQIDFEKRTQACDASFDKIVALVETLKTVGFAPEIIAGGSPTFPIHAHREAVECSPGTFIYWDKGYSEVCKEQPFIPAALVMSRVISLPGTSTLCLDLGHKSIAPENPLDRRVHFLNAPKLKFTSQSEEHLVVDAGQGHTFKVGDVLYGVPIHICPTVALYERGVIVEDHRAIDEWKILARDRKIEI